MNSWETVIPGELRRYKVPTGWMVESYSNEYKTSAMCFCPDPNHEWKIS